MAPILASGVQAPIDPRTAQAEMIDYIKTHFADVLGADAALLESADGLDALAARLHAMARTFQR